MAIDLADPPWGTANSRRGAKHRTALVPLFRSFYRLGANLTPEEFGQWGITNAGLPPDGPAGSVAHIVHVIARSDLRIQKLNPAASHPAVREHGIEPFKLVVVKLNKGERRYKLLRVEDAAQHQLNSNRLLTFMATQKHNLDQMFQAINWSALAAEQRDRLLDRYESFLLYHDAWLANAKLLQHQERGLLQAHNRARAALPSS